jgi:hypothetical protein
MRLHGHGRLSKVHDTTTAALKLSRTKTFRFSPARLRCVNNHSRLALSLMSICRSREKLQKVMIREPGNEKMCTVLTDYWNRASNYVYPDSTDDRPGLDEKVYIMCLLRHLGHCSYSYRFASFDPSKMCERYMYIPTRRREGFCHEVRSPERDVRYDAWRSSTSRGAE